MKEIETTTGIDPSKFFPDSIKNKINEAT